MAKLRGTINGEKFKDLRVTSFLHLFKSHYRSEVNGRSIVRYCSYEYTEVITVKITQGFRRDKWKQRSWTPGFGRLLVYRR